MHAHLLVRGPSDLWFRPWPKRMVRFADADHVYSDDIGTLAAAREFLSALPRAD